jgi:DNA repair protein RadC
MQPEKGAASGPRTRRGLGPRDQVLAAGPRALSDAELLGLVLDAGAATAGGRVLAERVLEVAGGIANLDRAASSAQEGLSRRRTAVLRAALEIGRRAAAVPFVPGEPLRDAARVWEHFRGRLPQLDREVFYVVLLDGRNRVQGEVRVSEGSLTTALVHPREVFAPAIRTGAAALVLAHNHPSGDPTPSAEDTVLTERLRQAGELIGVRVLDHVVIGRARWVSMANAGGW